MAYRKTLKITFTKNNVNLDNLSIVYNLPIGITPIDYTFRNTPTAIEDISINSPSNLPGQVSAQQFAVTFLQSNQHPQFTSTVQGNVVILVTEVRGYSFSFFRSNSSSGILFDYSQVDDGVDDDNEVITGNTPSNTAGYELVQTRSPYHIFTTGSDKLLTIINIWIYKGDKFADTPVESTYTLQSLNLSNKNNFEVAELVKSFIRQEFDGTYNTEGYWCKYNYVFTDNTNSTVNDEQSNYYFLYGLNGYNYFQEGVNPTLNPTHMLSSDVIDIPSNKSINLPLYVDNVDEVVIYDDSDSVKEIYDIIPYRGDNSNEKIFYLSLLSNNVSKIEIKSRVDDTYVTEFIKVNVIDECIYLPVKLTFVNKLGVLQDLWFFKKTEKRVKVKDDKYQANILNVRTQDFNTSSHQNRVLNKNGVESLTLNSGFISEENNETFRELLLSTLVWVTTYESKFDINFSVKPCVVKTSSLVEKTKLNDNLINYTIVVDIANKMINSIR